MHFRGAYAFTPFQPGFENGRVPSVKVGWTERNTEGQRYAQGLNSDENSRAVKGFASSTGSLRRSSKGSLLSLLLARSHIYSASLDALIVDCWC